MQMKSVTDQRWLAQIMCINRGSKFYIEKLPYYRKTHGDFNLMAEIQNGLNDWIDDTHGYYVRRLNDDEYLRIR